MRFPEIGRSSSAKRWIRRLSDNEPCCPGPSWLFLGGPIAKASLMEGRRSDFRGALQLDQVLQVDASGNRFPILDRRS